MPDESAAQPDTDERLTEAIHELAREERERGSLTRRTLLRAATLAGAGAMSLTGATGSVSADPQGTLEATSAGDPLQKVRGDQVVLTPRTSDIPTPPNPVVFFRGDEPAFFDVSIVSTNEPVNEGDTLTVDYSVENTGSTLGNTQDIRLDVGATERDRDVDVTLAGGSSTSGQLSWDSTTTGDYTATVLSDDDTASTAVSVGSGSSSTIPDAVTEWTTGGDAGFTISTGDPLSVSHDNEGAGDVGGMASDYVIDLGDDFVGEIVDVEFRNINFQNNSNGNNHLMIGVGDISPNQPARTNGNGLYYGNDLGGGSDAFDLVTKGSEDRINIDNVDWSSNHDVTVRVDDTGSSTTGELLIDGSSVESHTDMFQSNVKVIFQLINDNELSNSCDIDEIGVVKQ